MKRVLSRLLSRFGYRREPRVYGPEAMVQCIEHELGGSQYYLDAMWAAFRRETKTPVERVCLLETECEGGQMMYMFVDVMELE